MSQSETQLPESDVDNSPDAFVKIMLEFLYSPGLWHSCMFTACG